MLKLHPQLATAAHVNSLHQYLQAAERLLVRSRSGWRRHGRRYALPPGLARLRYRLAGRERTTTCHAAVPGPWPLLPSTPSSPAPTATGLNEKTNLRKKKPCLSPIAFIGVTTVVCAVSQSPLSGLWSSGLKLPLTLHNLQTIGPSSVPIHGSLFGSVPLSG